MLHDHTLTYVGMTQGLQNIWVIQLSYGKFYNILQLEEKNLEKNTYWNVYSGMHPSDYNN